MQQAGDDQVQVVVRLQALGQHPAMEDVPPDEGDQKGMLDVVVEGIALAEAFQRHPRGTVEPSASSWWADPNRRRSRSRCASRARPP